MTIQLIKNGNKQYTHNTSQNIVHPCDLNCNALVSYFLPQGEGPKILFHIINIIVKMILQEDYKPLEDKLSET